MQRAATWQGDFSSQNGQFLSIGQSKRAMLNPYQIYRADASPADIRVSRLAQYYSRVWEMDESLKELDETVASVGKYYKKSRRLEVESDSFDANTIVTQDGHSIYTNRHFIDNMQVMGVSSNNTRLRDTQSVRSSRAPKSSRSRRSGKRKNLEHVIRQTILKTASTDAPWKASSADSSDGTASTDDILRDLVQVNTVIASETQSFGSSVLSSAISATSSGVSSYPGLEPMEHMPVNLLPPLNSRSLDEQDDNPESMLKRCLPAWDAPATSHAAEKVLARRESLTPGTSDETNSVGEGEGRSGDCNRCSSGEAFGERDESDQFWTYSIESQTTIPYEDEPAIQQSGSFSNDTNNFWAVSDGWTTFDANPFHRDSDYHDSTSVESPSSVVNISISMKKFHSEPRGPKFLNKIKILSRASKAELGRSEVISF